MNASDPELSCLSPNNTDDFKHQVYPAAYVLIFVLGLAGHALSVCIFFSQWRTQKSFTPVNLLMVNLLVSDLMLVSSLPLRVSYYILKSHWIFGHITCKLISYVYYLNMYSSVYFLVALNILRYLALVRPYMYIRIQRHYVAGIVCALIWLLMGLGCSPLLFTERKDNDLHSFRCLELAEDNVDKLLLINNVTFPVGFVLPLVVIIFSSVLVARNLLRPSPALGRTRPCRKKACALVIISLGIFLVCFLPYHVVRTIFLITENQVQNDTYKDSCNYILVVRKAAVIAHCLCTANSCLDPVLFFFVGENSRSVFAKWTGGRKPSACTAGRNLQQEELHVLQN
ncbi:cysteinyl leukotriene receptor 2-like [Carassius gibelio]|uniref:cysteinyl leukotriene receptor 2-like n=1 Tax=Carassius gibelio TaxID=101364 RepID=UPI0022774F82|nr:cysteinyl leukotriene receptor 2-like [Carassius gibelio]